MSVNRARLQRPVLKRTKPIRTVGGQGQGPAKTVADGVRLGYSVIEDYLKRGQRAAKDGAKGSAKDGGKDGGKDAPFQSASNELQQLTERMFQYASDLASAWMELLQAMTTNGLAQRAANGANGTAKGKPAADADAADAAAPDPAAARAPAEEARPLSLEIDATQPIEVTVDLRRVPATGALEVSDLRARDRAAAPLVGVTIATPDDPPRTVVRLAVPAGQPAGVYTGLVLDADTNLPCGTIAVRVRAGVTAPR